MFIVKITTKSNASVARDFARFDDALAFAEYYLACCEPRHIQIDEETHREARCLMWAIIASNATTELVVIDKEPALRLRGYPDILYRSALYEALPEGFLNKATGEIVSQEYVKKALDGVLNLLRRWYGPEGTTIVREDWIRWWKASKNAICPCKVQDPCRGTFFFFFIWSRKEQQDRE